MAFSVNTNITSLQAQEYLRLSSEFQSKAINRVTSGLRIVQSGDDAAGLAIANGFRSDQAVLTQGVRNANDGLSTLQTIDGGMSNISKLLDRARTLATQSASGTFMGDRSVLNDEFKSLMTEIDRQAKAIGLNGGGDFAKFLSVFVGGGRGSAANDKISNGTVSVDLSRSTVDTGGLGLKGYAVTGTDLSSTNIASTIGATASFSFQVKGSGYTSGVAVTVNTNNVQDLGGLVKAINNGLSAAGAGNTAYAAANIKAGISSDGKSITLTSAGGPFAVTNSSADALTNTFLGTTGTDVSLLSKGAYNKTFNYSTTTAVTQKITVSTVDDSGKIQQQDITLAAGTAIAAAISTINTTLQGSQKPSLQGVVATLDANGDKISFISSRNFSVTPGATAGNLGLGAADGLTVTADDDSANAVSLDISSASSAEVAVTALGTAVETLGKAQAVVGKGQNQFSYAINLAQSQLGNLAAAESRIRDADLANEAANLTKAQILLQAGVAALAQANSAPQQILSLLRG